MGGHGFVLRLVGVVIVLFCETKLQIGNAGLTDISNHGDFYQGVARFNVGRRIYS